MKDSVYSAICSSYDILCEAIEALADNYDLIDNIIVYLDDIISYIKSDAAEQIELINMFIRLKKLFVNENFDNIEETMIKLREEIFISKIDYFNVSELRAERNFVKYIDWLIKAKEAGFCIFITSKDTPCGAYSFSRRVGEHLCSLGLDYNLSYRNFASYCAFIDNDYIMESYSDSTSVSLFEKFNDSEVFIESSGASKRDSLQKSNIIINSRNVAVSKRGLSFVIYDKNNDVVIDSVNFDTYSDQIPCFRYCISPEIKKIIKENPDVIFIGYSIPQLQNREITENEKEIEKNRITMKNLLSVDGYRSPLCDYMDEEHVNEVFCPPESYIGTDGARHFVDCESKYLNTVNGHRVTVGQPDNFKRTLYTVGACGIMGIGLRDEGTLASWLQKHFNQFPSEGFIVENYGFGLDKIDRHKEIVSILNSIEYKPGDIVIAPEYVFESELNNVMAIKIKNDVYKYGEIYWDCSFHNTEYFFRVIAESIFEVFKSKNFFKEFNNIQSSSHFAPNPPNTNYGLSEQQEILLNDYKEKLSQLWENDLKQSENVGAIVMNCNPFTLGHRYLIEQASEQCEQLIIFVVQEDKSFFSFDDRIALVENGVSDLSNVHVVESGQFIISSLTFKEYFNKSSLQDRTIDSSDDVTLFVNEIVPPAHIKKRFVGTEPFDKVTNQYNRTLKRILPNHGVELIEIPRKALNGQIISASKVREFLENGQFDEIRKIVPETTYRFLNNNFGISR